MILKVKKLHPNAVIPTKAHSDDAGYDLTAVSKTEDEYGNIVYGTGIAVQPNCRCFSAIFPRSSNAKKDLLLSNSVGVVDKGYNGEIFVKFKKLKDNPEQYEVGERIAQLIVIELPEVEIAEVDELDQTDRGAGAYGSTGK